MKKNLIQNYLKNFTLVFRYLVWIIDLNYKYNQENKTECAI